MSNRAPLEIWGGVECTVNRVRDGYMDQLARNGHERRLDDLDLFARLGLRTLRQPFLWEKIAPAALSDGNWSWAAERLDRLRTLGIRPIAGLLHHGSGPTYTSLMADDFAEKFAAYAGEFARRFPDVDAYTPVNEPLTTARFSGLYGFWYPHAADDKSFVRALLNQCRATALAMAAIRQVRPDAQLVQTEDLGKASSTPKVRYQAKFENERRWLSFDLLYGRVNAKHPLWKYLRRSGATEAQLQWFADNPCPPDIFGINHYLTSNRHLDERLSSYPSYLHGGNRRHRYVDAEAIRVADVEPRYLDTLLLETWERYGRPLAVTEVHLDSTREEQLRWLLDVWGMAGRAREGGADVRAITAWGLLGHFDWRSLVTREAGDYESGVFDMRGGKPRPTVLTKAIESLATRGDFAHPVLDVPGWWRRDVRALYPPPPKPDPAAPPFYLHRAPAGSRPPLLIAGTGTLGRAFARICENRALPYRLCGRGELDIADAVSVREALTAWKPWAVINAAGYVRVDDAEAERARCFRENVQGSVTLAEECAWRNTPYLSFSSDLVFDGQSTAPYGEESAVAPLNVYGASKAEAERKILECWPRALVVRTSAFFGPWDEANFLHGVLAGLRRGEEVPACGEIRVSPTYVPDLVHACLDLLIDEASGIWHLANAGAVTWHEFGYLGASRARLDVRKVVTMPLADCRFKAVRPVYSVLGSRRGNFLPPLEDAIERYFRDIR